MSDNESQNKTTLICPHTKRFESIFVCAINCQNRCGLYLDNITLSILEEFVQQHPEYEIIGEIMPVKNVKDTDKKKKVKEYWIVDEDDRIEEVTLEEILKNPQLFIGKEIWDKPPNEYEIVVALKRKK